MYTAKVVTGTSVGASIKAADLAGVIAGDARVRDRHISAWVPADDAVRNLDKVMDAVADLGDVVRWKYAFNGDGEKGPIPGGFTCDVESGDRVVQPFGDADDGRVRAVGRAGAGCGGSIVPSLT